MTNRTQDGFSLILVMSLGLISLLMVMAVSAALVPLYQNMGAQGVTSSNASAAELGMQYALAQLNSAAAAGKLSSVNSPIVVPSSLTNNTNVTVTFTLLDTTLYPNLATSPIFNLVTYGAPVNATDYRLLTSVASSGINKSTINVIVGPYMMKSSLTGPKALFSNALFAENNLQLKGQVNVMTEGNEGNEGNESGSGPQASVGSNNQIGLLGTNTVDGNINAYNGSPTATSITASSNSTVNGNVTYSGNVSNLNDPGGPSPFTVDSPGNVFLANRGLGPDPNVLADGQTGQKIGSVTPGTSITNQTPLQALTGSSPATMTVGGANTVNVSPSQQSSVSDLGAINLSGNQVMVLTPGNYTASSINISGNAQMQVSVPSQATSGVSISVQGNSPGTVPISIAGNGIAMTGSAAPAPSNFQLFYNGTNNIQISMSSNFNTFYGLLYSPNATVNLNTGNIRRENKTEFHGAIAANNLTATGTGSIFFDPNSIKPSNGGGGGVAAGPGSTPITPGSVQRFNVLSWQEPTRAMAP